MDFQIAITGFVALYVFMLAAFAGWVIIGSVPAILHTPLMSGSNFVHGIVVVGGIFALLNASTVLEQAIGFFAVLLGAVCSALLAVTAFGIVGLTSYWVTRRRRQIGIRRALGATRGAIFGYFQTENFLIAAAGALVGIACAVGLNLWLVSSFEMVRLQIGFALVGAGLMLLLGQAAAFWPALRAASISPALATRSG